jgi:cytochrome bd-type quinol oxidase subunit 1
MLYMATGKPVHLGCKFLLDVSVVNSPIVVELLVITVLFCVVLPASCWTYFTTIKHDARNHKC